jgi:DUF2971 family protein
MSHNISIYRPLNVDRSLWRYMSFLKVVDLLQRRSLWFTRLDYFQDPYEGFLPEIITRLSTGENSTVFQQFQYENWRKMACANCWYMSDYESAAMWDLYSKDGGIAITSRVSRLEQCFPLDLDVGSFGLYGNAVKYVDFEKTKLETFDAQGAVIRAQELHCKRKSFEHEREYRLTLRLEEDEAKKDIPGKFVPVALDKLIERIYVSPTAPAWVAEVVQKAVQTYNLDVPVIQSDLYAPVVK